MDIIKIKDLEVYAKHGVLKEENVLGQKFLISVNMYVEKFTISDDLTKTINYAQVCKKITDIMQTHTYKLIETVANHIADMILIDYNEVKKVCIEVKKPWAPVGLPLDTVSVEIERKRHKVYLGLGSNMGDKEKNIKQAIDIISMDICSKVNKCSELIITKPYGGVEQDDFLNGVMEIETIRTPEELLELIRMIEKKLERVRTIHWGPRTIDVDILLYDDLIINTKDLIIPHNQMHLREFVLKPFCEIAPEIVHPALKKSIKEIYNEFQKKGMIKL